MTGLEKQVSEIVLRCTAKVCLGFSPGRICDIAEPVIGHVTWLISQSDPKDFVEVECDRYEVWAVMNAIIDEVAKEIPAADRIEIIGKNLRRSHRTAYKRFIQIREDK